MIFRIYMRTGVAPHWFRQVDRTAEVTVFDVNTDYVEGLVESEVEDPGTYVVTVEQPDARGPDRAFVVDVVEKGLEAKVR